MQVEDLEEDTEALQKRRRNSVTSPVPRFISFILFSFFFIAAKDCGWEMGQNQPQLAIQNKIREGISVSSSY